MRPCMLALALLTLGAVARAAAPPVVWRDLTKEESREASRLAEALDAAIKKGEFQQAVEVARRLARFRRHAQGPHHPDALEAEGGVELLYGLDALTGTARQQARDSLLAQRKATLLRGKRDYRGAESTALEGLALMRRAVGERHPQTAWAYKTLADVHEAEGKHARTSAALARSLAILRETRPDAHLVLGGRHGDLGMSLTVQHKDAEAQAHFEKAADHLRRAVGEAHPQTVAALYLTAFCQIRRERLGEARRSLERVIALQAAFPHRSQVGVGSSCVMMAAALERQGDLAQAQVWYAKALAPPPGTKAPDDLVAASALQGLGAILMSQGKYADALVPLHGALKIHIARPNLSPPLFAKALNSVGYVFDMQGRYALGQEYLDNALQLARDHLGEEHPETLMISANLAYNLTQQRKWDRAKPLLERALALTRAKLGPTHPDTLRLTSNLASLLDGQGKHAEAQPYHEKVLAARRQQLGEQHPDTARSYNNVAGNLVDQGKFREARPFYHKARAGFRGLGDGHPTASRSAINASINLWTLGRVAESVHLLQECLPGEEVARFHTAASGFDRARVSASAGMDAHTVLAAGLAILGQPRNAFARAEAGLARGLLDDLPRPDSEQSKRLAALSALQDSLDRRLIGFVGRSDLSAVQQKERDGLLRQRRELFNRLSREATLLSAERVRPASEIQQAIPADAALVLYVGNTPRSELLACVLRREGDPVWQRLPASGVNGGMTTEDSRELTDLRDCLVDPRSDPRVLRKLTEAARRRLLEPLGRHLGPRGGLPAARRLLVVPVDKAALLPIEVLADRYQVSYVPSGSVLARLREKARPLSAAPLLALGDPAFLQASKPSEPPRYGVLLKSVLPGGNAEKAGLRAGDVLLTVGERRLESAEDLDDALTEKPAAITYWRDGLGQGRARLAGKPLGAVTDPRSAPAAVRAWRSAAPKAGPHHPALPGTRLEVEAIERLVPAKGATVLLGRDASGARLDVLRRGGKLKGFRVLHLATHGEADASEPEQSALILAPREGGRPDERLTVEAIRRTWELDADLVVLSACGTALGADAKGDGLLGFAHALIQKGARSVVLSRWKVDDAATALLMVRFYENLLGSRKGTKPMGRAAALDEAKRWLRELPRKQAGELAALLSGGELRGTVAPGKPAAKPKVAAKLPEGDRPFAHPFYWAAFVLVGDPD